MSHEPPDRRDHQKNPVAVQRFPNQETSLLRDGFRLAKLLVGEMRSHGQKVLIYGQAMLIACVGPFNRSSSYKVPRVCIESTSISSSTQQPQRKTNLSPRSQCSHILIH